MRRLCAKVPRSPTPRSAACCCSLVIWGPTPAFRNVWWILVFAALLALGVTMLRRETALEFPGIEHDQALHDFREQRAESQARTAAPHQPPATGMPIGEARVAQPARCSQQRARRDARATSRAARPRRDHRRRIPGREGTRHEQRQLRTGDTHDPNELQSPRCDEARLRASLIAPACSGSLGL